MQAEPKIPEDRSMLLHPVASQGTNAAEAWWRTGFLWLQQAARLQLLPPRLLKFIVAARPAAAAAAGRSSAGDGGRQEVVKKVQPPRRTALHYGAKPAATPDLTRGDVTAAAAAIAAAVAAVAPPAAIVAAAAPAAVAAAPAAVDAAEFGPGSHLES